MPETISASAMRDRLLSRLKTPPIGDEWLRVLGVPGHRDLLGLIARHNPPSIGALAELAARAQPNVSRALNALVAAGLIEIVSSGRRSIPQITETGAAKALELGLLEAQADVAALESPATDLFAVEATGSVCNAEPSGDTIEGRLTTWFWLISSKEKVAARTECDLNALGLRLLENWWRLLHRRDAPFRLWEFTLEEPSGASYFLAATVLGAKVNLHAHTASGRMLDLEHASRVYAVATFEQHLLDEVLRPLAAHHWLKGRSARRMHALLRRVEDSRGQPAERDFCRTAGALGLAPYDLSDDCAAQIRDLLDLIPDEDARLDFSSAVLADRLEAGRLWTRHELERFGHRNAMPALMQLRDACTKTHKAPAQPYRHGYALARSAREFLGLAADQPVDGIEGLSKLLGARESIGLSPDAPGALRAFQSFDGDAPTFIVENEGRLSSVFTLARGVGDFVAFGNRVSCVADLYTDRQAVGRAFAAEFMAPRNVVVQMIEEEDQPVSQIADHFGVSVPVVNHQYQNAFN